MEHQYHLTRISANQKLGGLPASTTSYDSCPKNCSYRDGNGCYGMSGPINFHWKAVTDRTRGVGLDEFCAQVKALPKYQLWRHNQVGDLPGDGRQIHGDSLVKIVKANKGKKGFTFTHYDPRDPLNAGAVRFANQAGLTVNLSAESLAGADEFVALGVGPVVVALPASAKRSLKTPAGNQVSICPATVRDDVTCAHCALCAEPDRKTVIGFPAHGTTKAKVEAVFWAKEAATAEP